MKADYEPWWQFEGWEEYVVTEVTYDNEQEACFIIYSVNSYAYGHTAK